jgi:hypothetical protein
MSGSAHHRYRRRQDPVRGAKPAKFEFVLHLSAPRYAKPKQLRPSIIPWRARNRERVQRGGGLAPSSRGISSNEHQLDSGRRCRRRSPGGRREPPGSDCLSDLGAPHMSRLSRRESRSAHTLGRAHRGPHRQDYQRSRQQRAVRRLWQHGGADIFAEASAIADRQERQHPAWSRQALPQNVVRRLRSVEIPDIRRRRRTAY